MFAGRHIPFATAGQRIGLLGGSFDPAHAGHLHVSREALKRFGLDQLWWLVSPGNPLKARAPADLARRCAYAADLVVHPRVHVTDIEARFGTRYSIDLITQLQRRRPALRFLWMMGADNLITFHDWKDWQVIAERIPIGVLARPGYRMAARCSVAGRYLRRWEISESDSGSLGQDGSPAYCQLNIPMMRLSSTTLRAAGKWQAP